MVEEGTTTPEGAPAGQPRVVKKVVKRTVVRPSAPGAATPTRPKTQAPRATAMSRLGKDAPRPGADAAAEPAAPTPRGPRATIDVGAKASAAGQRVRAVGGGGVHLLRRGWYRVRDATEDSYLAVRDWRVPELAPVPAGIVTGVLAGLLVVAGGGLAQMLFTATRGTSAGGGTWGILALLLVVAVVHEVAARLLTAFGGTHARAVTALSAIVVAVVVMVGFVDAVDGPWAWLILPGLCAVVVPLVQQLLTWSTEE